MRRDARIAHRLGLVAMVAGLALGAGMAMAEEMSEIVVEGDRPTSVKLDKDAPFEVIMLSRHVRYGDLHLETAAGAAELEKRVKDAAEAVCKKLDELYPATVRGGNECQKQAVKTAMVKGRAAVAAAGKGKAGEAASSK